MEAAEQVLERVIYQDGLVQIGLFRCPPSRPDFAEAGPITGHLLVFPRTSVCIIHAGRVPVIASPNVVMFYNRGQSYRRSPISTHGDMCEWFAYEPGVVAEALRSYDMRVEDHIDQPFAFTHGPSNPSSYLMQRRMVEYLLGNPSPDRLLVEETALWILESVLEHVCSIRESKRSLSNRAQQDLVYQIEAILCTRFTETLTLKSISNELGYSPYHLSHIFRRQMGTSIHRYLNQMRLHTALEMISERGMDLTEIAVNLGYSHHSHFTMAFHKAFSLAPSQLRDMPFSRCLRHLRKNLIA
jgi:AraC family transcriptional regulator